MAFSERHRGREENRTLSQSGVCCSVHCFFLYGDNPRGSMRCNGKNLRPKLLNDTSSWSWESGDLNSGLDSAAHPLRHVAPRLCLAFVSCQEGSDQPFLPNKVAVRIQGDGG